MIVSMSRPMSLTPKRLFRAALLKDYTYIYNQCPPQRLSGLLVRKTQMPSSMPLPRTRFNMRCSRLHVTRYVSSLYCDTRDAKRNTMTIAPPFKQVDCPGATNSFALPRMTLRFAFKDTMAACVALTKETENRLPVQAGKWSRVSVWVVLPAKLELPAAWHTS